VARRKFTVITLTNQASIPLALSAVGKLDALIYLKEPPRCGD
jgi:hypothetical protein